MNKTLRILAFLAAYMLFAASLVWLKKSGGWWWLVPMSGVIAMIVTIAWYQADSDEVVSKIAFRAYVAGFWALILVLLGLDTAAAFGTEIEVPLVWAVGMLVWVCVYLIGMWRVR